MIRPLRIWWILDFVRLRTLECSYSNLAHIELNLLKYQPHRIAERELHSSLCIISVEVGPGLLLLGSSIFAFLALG